MGLCIQLFLIGKSRQRVSATQLNEGRPLLFAHRGGADSVLENSVEAFNKAISMGFTGIETDIRATKDGKLIIFHDENCLRLLGIDTNISEMYWKDIQSLNLFFENKPTKQKVISLEELMLTTETNIVWYLDIKTTNKTIADSLVQIIGKINRPVHVLIADESYLFLLYVMMLEPSLNVVLEDFESSSEWMYYFIPRWLLPDYYASFLWQVNESHLAFLNENNLLKNKIVYGGDLESLKGIRPGLQNIILDYSPEMGDLRRYQQSFGVTTTSTTNR